MIHSLRLPSYGQIAAHRMKIAYRVIYVLAAIAMAVNYAL
jgi:hypothetical protein